MRCYNAAMRFTIRHLLWFTLLAAVGCWWWMPSANDAKELGYVLDDSAGVQRFTAMNDALRDTFANQLDFARRDAVYVPADPYLNFDTLPQNYLDFFNTD